MTVSSLKSVGSQGGVTIGQSECSSNAAFRARLALLSLRRSPIRAMFKANFPLIEQSFIEFAAVARRPTGTQNYPLENQNS
jgi:hypothetical protein